MVSNLETFMIHTKVKLAKQPGGKVRTIVGHSTCGCWALLLAATGEITFGIRCEDVTLKTGYSMPVEADTDIKMTYDGTMAIILINNEVINEKKMLFKFKCGGKLDIGGYSTSGGEVWPGLINFVAIYDEGFTAADAKALKDPKKPKPAPAGGGGGGGGGDEEEEEAEAEAEADLPLSGPILTVDDRECVGVCTTNALPGMPNAPEPPIEAALGQPEYGPGADVDEAAPEEDAGPAPEEGGKEEKSAINVAIDIKCNINA